MNNQGRVGGVTHLTENDAMNLFDQLPKPARELLANAPFNYAVGPMRQAIAAWGLPYTLKLGHETMASHVSTAARIDYGPDHPQAKGGDNAKGNS